MMNPLEVQQQNGVVTIWRGTLEWIEKLKPLNEPKSPIILPCTVSTLIKEGQIELNSKLWSNKLMMQLIPQNYVNGLYIRNEQTYMFHPTPCDALDTLIKYMTYGFVGYVQLNNTQALLNWGVKVLILLYTTDCEFVGVIPNDEPGFFNRLPEFTQNRIDSLGLIIQGLSPRIALQVMQTRRQQKQRKRQGLNSTITHQIDVPYFQFTTRPDQRQLTLSKISIQQCTTTLVSSARRTANYMVSSRISGSNSNVPNVNESISRNAIYNDPVYISEITANPIQSEPVQMIRQPRGLYYGEGVLPRNARERAEH